MSAIFQVCNRRLITSMLSHVKVLNSSMSKSKKEASTPKLNESNEVPHYLNGFKEIYRNPHISKIAMLVRLKIYQSGLVCITVPCVMYSIGFQDTDPKYLGLSLGASAFSVCLLTVVGEYARRIVGIIHIHESRKIVKIARISFWGNRKDIIHEINNIVPISEGNENTNSILWGIKFYDEKETTLFINTRIKGSIKDKKDFEYALGKLDSQR